MDRDRIPELIELARSPAGLANAQDIAAKALEAGGFPKFPTNACAATLSALLRLSGINVPMTLGAGMLAEILDKDRSWERIDIGDQKPGDVGVTIDKGGLPGADHIYLVIERLDADAMLIADNQKPVLHERSAKGKTRTDYFLRATEDA